MANTKISALTPNTNPSGSEEMVYALNNANGKMTLNTMKTFVENNLTGYATTGDLTTGLAGKQDTLVSGTNIRTINGSDLLGSGNLDISGGVAYTAGPGIDITGGTISNTGVTSVNGQTGDVTVSGGGGSSNFDAVLKADGTGDYATIDAAISAGCKSIYLKAGTYNTTSLTSNHDLHLISYERPKIVYDGNAEFLDFGGTSLYIEGIDFDLTCGTDAFYTTSGWSGKFIVSRCSFTVADKGGATNFVTGNLDSIDFYQDTGKFNGNGFYLFDFFFKTNKMDFANCSLTLSECHFEGVEANQGRMSFANVNDIILAEKCSFTGYEINGRALLLRNSNVEEVKHAYGTFYDKDANYDITLVENSTGGTSFYRLEDSQIQDISSTYEWNLYVLEGVEYSNISQYCNCIYISSDSQVENSDGNYIRNRKANGNIEIYTSISNSYLQVTGDAGYTYSPRIEFRQACVGNITRGPVTLRASTTHAPITGNSFRDEDVDLVSVMPFVGNYVQDNLHMQTSGAEAMSNYVGGDIVVHVASVMIGNNIGGEISDSGNLGTKISNNEQHSA